MKTETMKVVRPPRPTGRPKIKAVSKILMAPKPSGPPRKKRPMSPGELKARTGKTVMADGGTVDKMKKKVRDTFKKLKLTGPAGQKKKLQDMLKKKKKDKIKDKVKQKLKEKKKSKPTKTGLLSKAGIAPVSAPGGIPKVQSQKTAQKDPPKKDKPPKRVDRPDFKPKPMPMPMPRPKPGAPKPMPMPRPKRPDRPKFGPIPMPRPSPEQFKRFMDDMPKRVKAMKDGGELKKMFGIAAGAGMSRAKLKRLFEMAKLRKPTGRINVDDIKRVAKMLGSGKKPVLDSKGKPVKNLFQKSKKRDLKSIVKTGPKGMRKAFGGKNLKAAARKMRKMM